MDFEDEVREVIQKARADKERYERETKEFEDEWYRLRNSRLSPLLRDAAVAFKHENIGTHKEDVNGTTVLRAVYNKTNDSYRHRLSFEANIKGRMVICSSDLFNQSESFTLDHLTEAHIQRKIKEFADLVARGNTPRPD